MDRKVLQKMLQNLFFLYKFLLKLLGYTQGKINKNLKYMKYESMVDRYTTKELQNSTLVFEFEGGLLRSNSLFPYFMLVAFEGGGVLRGLVLFLLYPLVCLVSREMGLKIMVFICFFGVKRDSFLIGGSVLPKWFLEGLGFEGFEVVMRCGKRVGVSELPRVMVEGFLKDFLDVDCVFGKDLKVVCGYFVGLIEDVTPRSSFLIKDCDHDLIGFGSSNKILDHQVFSLCKEIYMVTEAEKRRWRALPSDKYPKPLIFHDGRIAFEPTFFGTLAMIIWVPFGSFVCLLRIIITISFPYTLMIPILSFTGMRGRLYVQSSSNTILDQHTKESTKNKGTLFVCNHKTLLDPIYISIAIMKPLIAVTYSLSRFSELLSPLKTFQLSRNKEKDSKMMDMLLSQGDLVVCPEGTTCREPYVLRFSPLFAELSNEIVPVALDAKVSMFYGTTASGFKFLDPLFFALNPIAIYHVKILEKLESANTRARSRIEVANEAQKRIADALGFKCTNLTRRDKYMILVGNEGVV